MTKDLGKTEINLPYKTQSPHCIPSSFFYIELHTQTASDNADRNPKRTSHLISPSLTHPIMP